MTIDTKLNLNNYRFEQSIEDVLNLSGKTQIYGELSVYSNGKIDSINGYNASGVTIIRNSPNTLSTIFIGNSGNDNSTGINNIGIGIQTLSHLTSGCNNVAYGYHALCNVVAGNNNFAVGCEALMNSNYGCNNIALGVQSLRTNSVGNDNISVGFAAGFSNSIGCNNIFIGRCAGYNETGSGKLYIATGATRSLVYGDFSTNEVTLPKLKLCEIPTDGTPSNSILVWDSSSCCVKKMAANCFAPSSGSTNYIQNQNSAAQNAYAWISGSYSSNAAGEAFRSINSTNNAYALRLKNNCADAYFGIENSTGTFFNANPLTLPYDESL